MGVPDRAGQNLIASRAAPGRLLPLAVDDDQQEHDKLNATTKFKNPIDTKKPWTRGQVNSIASDIPRRR